MTRFLLFCLLFGLVPSLAVAAPVRTDHVEAELIAERSAFAPGTDNYVALRLRPDRDWHVYWRNPGDSGIATSLSWTLPSGVSAGEIQWPYPHVHRLGDLSNYGYGEQVLHLVPIMVTGIGGDVTLRAKARWLVCKDICIPGEADLQLTRPVRGDATIDPDWAPDFERARAQLPRDGRAWPAQFQVAGDSVSLRVDDARLAEADRIEFFPYANDLVNHAAAQRQAREGERLRLSQELSAYFVDPPTQVEGVLVLHRGDRAEAWEIAARPGTVAAVAGAAMQPLPSAPADGGAAETATPGLLLVLGFALIGGLILNLMPCVFPVLSLKALAIAQGGRESPRERQRQSLSYTAGVVLSCVAIAAAMLALRAAGTAVGWGFQLQSPLFIALLAYLLFALGLSLSGAAQFGVGLMNLGNQYAQRPGLSGAFFTGVLAVVVATPCTAPFMGTALGYAMTQPAAVSLTVFAVLGLGLALPFLLIGFVPAAARLLPRPGAWMERFKQFMAFPLYATVVWLLWILVRQTDPEWLARAMLGLVLIAFALWLWPLRGPIAALLKLAALFTAAGLVFAAPSPSPAPTTAPALTQRAEPWSAPRVAELRAEGRTVFVDFTADWCLTCKVNERVALKSARVESAFRERDVALLVADWTRANPAITAELARFGRNGVPLYLVYRNGGEPVVLPQLLSPDIVIESIQ